MSDKKFFKIVRKFADEYRSFNADINDDAQVTYLKGKFVSKKYEFGPLAVFSSERNALDFLQKCGFIQLYRNFEDFCENESFKNKSEYSMDDFIVFECEIIPSEFNYLFDGKRHSRTILPEGTVFAEKVKLTVPII